MQETDTQRNKLILLFMLRQVPGISSDAWMNWAIDSLYLDYFSFAQTREALQKNHLVTESVRKDEKRLDASGFPIRRCDLTPEGEAIIEQLFTTLPSQIREYLHEEGRKRKHRESEKNSVFAAYETDANGKYQVTLSLSEFGQNLLHIQLQAPNKRLAKEICQNWKGSTADIYSHILALLENNKSSPE